MANREKDKTFDSRVFLRRVERLTWGSLEHVEGRIARGLSTEPKSPGRTRRGREAVPATRWSEGVARYLMTLFDLEEGGPDPSWLAGN